MSTQTQRGPMPGPQGQSQAPAQPQPQSQRQPAASEFSKLMERSVRYTPFAETDEIELTFGQVKQFISARTARGNVATDSDIVKFMMLCKSRGLNPWVGDAYLVGYDGKDGPVFSLITSINALLKRAEANPNFDGLQQGVLVRTADGATQELEGDFVPQGRTLVGGWARCYRKDRTVPFYDSLSLSTYDKQQSQWNKDKAGMIVKCAQASVLRTAFPSQLSGLYITQEMAEATYERRTSNIIAPRTLDDLARQLGERGQQAKETSPKSQPAEANPTHEAEPEVLVDHGGPHDLELPPEPPPQAWGLYVQAIAAAKTAAEVTAIYDKAFGPDSTIEWTIDEAKQGADAANARKEQLAKESPRKAPKRDASSPSDTGESKQ